ncbi:MAG TPA: hypothetical protein VII69_06300 [Candidatus Eremiobacteraceae bacterium]
MMLPVVRTCPTCGAENEAASLNCAECDEPFSESPDEGGNPLRELEKFPAWARWLIALPGVSIVAAIVIRQLASAGFHDIANTAIYAVAMAIAIVAAAQAAAFIAPSYRTEVGLVVAIAELAVILKVLVSAASQDLLFHTQVFPAWIAVLYLVIPSMGIIFLTHLLARNKSLIDEPIVPITIPGGLGLQWWLGILAALGLGAAFEAIAVGVGALCPACLPRSSSESLASVIGTGIIVALVADYAPARKMVAAWVIAGLTFLNFAITIVLCVVFLIRYPEFASLNRFYYYYFLIVAAELAGGAAIGLRAAAQRQS